MGAVVIGPVGRRVRCPVCWVVVRAYHDEPHTATVHEGPDGKRCDGSPGGARHAAVRS